MTSAEKICHQADFLQNKVINGQIRLNIMSDDDKFKNFRSYHFESEQSERNASRRKWSLILIVACSSVGIAYLLSS